MQPGETINPGGTSSPTSPAPQEQAPAAESVPAGVRRSAEISWSASEYVAHEKNSGWYILVGLGASLLAGGTYWMTGDTISTVVIIVVGIIFGFAASRQPRTLTYSLDHAGVQIGDKFYPYADFKSFSILEEDAIYSIMLLPMKRFMPGLSMYYPPDQEDEILTVLNTYLPHEERTVDMVDRLARKLRF